MTLLPPPATATRHCKGTGLGRKLKVNGTPALIFADGTINPGYLPAAELQKALNAAASR
jgi:thiol:disulfide interchange protein DsbC